MSFILDALKRADHERQRGAVPDIHAHVDGPPSATALRSARLGPWAWVALGAALSVAAAMAWQAWLAPKSQPTNATAGRASASSTPAAPPMAAPPSAIELPGRSASPPISTPSSGNVKSPGAITQTAPFLPSSPAVAASAARRSNQPLTLKEAPEEVRRQLATIRLAGGVHSPRPADRLLIVDGQVAREGETVANGILLEQIQPRSAIFRIREYRVEVPY